MTKEEIIELVMQIGGCDRPEENSPALKMFVTFATLVANHEREACTAHAITSAEKAINVAIKLEREACAKIADGWPDYDVQGLAEAIRARGNTE
jgi:hypothetical protein